LIWQSAVRKDKSVANFEDPRRGNEPGADVSKSILVVARFDIRR
jgi:hypothetical protein